MIDDYICLEYLFFCGMKLFFKASVWEWSPTLNHPILHQSRNLSDQADLQHELAENLVHQVDQDADYAADHADYADQVDQDADYADYADKDADYADQTAGWVLELA